jgi:hypothetical protein
MLNLFSLLLSSWYEEISGYTPHITLVVMDYRNWKVKMENDSKRGHIIHCYFLELGPTHQLCNSSANLNMH